MKAIVLTVFLLTLSIGCFSQQAEWSVVDGKARLQKVITVPDRDASYIYQQIGWWLVSTFRNPEDVLKARIEKEYLKGEAYQPKLFQPGALSSADFQYHFTIEIKNGKVRFTLTDGILVHPGSEDGRSVFPIELYFKNLDQNRKDLHAEKVLTSVNTLSDTLITSLEKFLSGAKEEKNDW